MSKFPKRIQIVRIAGRAKKATMPNGDVVWRPNDDILEIPEQNGVRRVKGAPYDNHFVYVVPNPPLHSPFLLCTCGSYAVITGYNAYAKMGSPTSGDDIAMPGEMVVCFVHTQTMKHADGST